MQTNSKKLILSILLILPILVFLFLSFFGKNHYKLITFYPLDSIQVEGKWKVVNYHTIPKFSLINQNGETINQNTLKGKIYVTDFFFTSCGNPTLCPRMSSELKRVQEKIKNQEDVLIVSHTVDPVHDTPEVLKKYAQSYGAIDGKWHFLTGDKKSIYDLAYHGYKINAGEEKNTPTPEFMHAVKFILVDKEGRIRGYYDGTDREQVDKLLVEIQVLQYEYKNKSSQ